MVFLINAIPALIILLGAFVAYKVKGWKRKVGTVLIVIGLVVLYGQIQPSYIPKGTVKDLPRAEFRVDDSKIQDRMRKTISAEERDARMAKADKETNERIEALIERSKSEKE